MKILECLKALVSRRKAQGPFRRLFAEPQQQNIGGIAGVGNRAAGGTIPPEQVLNALHGGTDKEYQSTAFQDMDPRTMRITDTSIEHSSIGGELVKDVVNRKVRTCEKKFVSSDKLIGECLETGMPATELFHCVISGCGKAVCKVHSVPIDGNPDSKVRACRACAKAIEFNRNSWAEFDA
jgi:hypothetical protein